MAGSMGPCKYVVYAQGRKRLPYNYFGAKLYTVCPHGLVGHRNQSQALRVSSGIEELLATCSLDFQSTSNRP